MGYTGLQRLDNIVSRLNTHPEYVHLPKEQHLWRMQCNVAQNAYELEERFVQEQAQNPPTTFRDFAIDPSVERRFASAWKLLAANSLSAEVLKESGLALVEGAKSNNHPKEQLDALADDLVTRTYPSSVHRAIDAGIRIMSMHLLDQGNYRLSQLVQNFCLHQRGYPPAFVNHTEHDFVLGILNATVQERVTGTSMDQPGVSERHYHNYVIGSTLAAAELWEETMKRQRFYRVTIQGAGVHIQQTQNAIEYAAKKRGCKLQISEPETNQLGTIITVRGDIGLDELQHSFDGNGNGRKAAITYAHVEPYYALGTGENGWH